jgi:serine/threonine protein kinase, bacterial
MLKFIYDYFENELPPGTIIANKYELQHSIGKGSYGITYLARDIETELTVVVKQNRKRKRKNGVKSFQNEAKILSLFDHPSIPKLIDFHEWEKSLFIVMELKEGKTIQHLIFEEGVIFTEKESFKILRKIIEIVKLIHLKDVVHLDLRTPNILLQDNQVNIIDFGLARIISNTSKKPKENFKHPNVTNDFYELGHFLLFMIYSNFEPSPKSNKRDSWQDELSLTAKGKAIIERLLQIEKPFESTEELLNEIDDYLEQIAKEEKSKIILG